LLEDILEEEVSRACEGKDREALKRCIRVVIESFSEKSDVNELGYEVKEGFKLISKDMLMVSDRLMELKEEISKVREETKEEIMEIRKETREEISEVREEIRLLIEMMNKRSDIKLKLALFSAFIPSEFSTSEISSSGIIEKVPS